MEGKFSDLYEGALNPAEAAELRAHFDACPACARGYKEFEEAMQALSGYRADDVPYTFTESVLSTVVTEPVRSARTWPLALSWILTAASILIAVFLFFRGPERIEIIKPVDREVVVEKVVEKEVPVPYEVQVVKEVPVIKEVPVREPSSVSIPVGEGAFKILRNGDALTVSGGETFNFQSDDDIRIVCATMPETVESIPFENVVIDFEPLASALMRAADAATVMSVAVIRTAPEVSSFRAAMGVEAASDVAAAEIMPLFTSREAPQAVVSLVWTPDGALELETDGSNHEVIPELIRLLDDKNAQVSAVALGRLETIQTQLQREHGIAAPRAEAASATEETDLLDDIRGLFTLVNEEEAPPVSTADIWRRWWGLNRASILCLACLN